jgi:hypothetical protein
VGEEETHRRNCLEKSQSAPLPEPLQGVVTCQEERRLGGKTLSLCLDTMNFRCWQDIQGKMSNRQSEMHY